MERYEFQNRNDNLTGELVLLLLGVAFMIVHAISIGCMIL